MSFAAAERDRLASLLLERGPDAPTLCEGWTTRDLAVHLYLRERRPDAAAGMFLAPLSGHLDKVAERVRRRDYRDLVRAWSKGPSALNPMRAADRWANAAEHFVHLEDVRRGHAVARGEEVPAPRFFTPQETSELFGLVRRMGPALLRTSTAPVVLQAPGLAPVTVTRSAVATRPPVTVTGAPGELLLWLFGRDAAHVQVDGDAGAARRSSI